MLDLLLAASGWPIRLVSTHQGVDRQNIPQREGPCHHESRVLPSARLKHQVPCKLPANDRVEAKAAADPRGPRIRARAATAPTCPSFVARGFRSTGNPRCRISARDFSCTMANRGSGPSVSLRTRSTTLGRPMPGPSRDWWKSGHENSPRRSSRSGRVIARHRAQGILVVENAGGHAGLDDGLRAREIRWRPLRLARVRCERESVCVVRPLVLRSSTIYYRL